MRRTKNVALLSALRGDRGTSYTLSYTGQGRIGRGGFEGPAPGSLKWGKKKDKEKDRRERKD